MCAAESFSRGEWASGSQLPPLTCYPHLRNLTSWRNRVSRVIMWILNRDGYLWWSRFMLFYYLFLLLVCIISSVDKWQILPMLGYWEVEGQGKKKGSVGSLLWPECYRWRLGNGPKWLKIMDFFRQKWWLKEDQIELVMMHSDKMNLFTSFWDIIIVFCFLM